MDGYKERFAAAVHPKVSIEWESFNSPHKEFIVYQDEYLRAALDTFLRVNRPDYEILFGFIEGYGLSPWVRVSSGVETIAVPALMPIVVRNFFIFCLRRRSLIPTEGKLLTKLAFADANVRIDSRLKRLIDWMASVVMIWMLYHELAHIWNGHLDFLTKVSPERGVEKRNFDEQTLEWDADSVATQLVMDMLLKDQTLADIYEWIVVYMGLSARPDVRNALAFPAAIPRYCAMFAISAFLGLWDREWTPDDAMTFSHPPTEIRRDVTCGLLQLLAKRDGSNPLHAVDLGVDARHQGEIALYSLYGIWPGRLRGWTTKGIEYVNLLDRNWAEVRPYLDTMKRGSANLAPFNSAPPKDGLRQ